MRIDAHQHFWSLANSYTDWPTPDLSAIYRDFHPDDLRPLLVDNNVDGSILVQAAPSVDETINLLDIARRYPFVKGVVGWVDFDSADACETVDQLAQHPALRGVRPMLQGIEEPGWILREDFAPVFNKLIEHGLCFDGLVRADQIGDLAVIAARYPSLKLVLDHGGKPAIAAGEFETWAQDVRALAANANAYCKISGLWTEAGDDHSQGVIAPYIALMVEAFGPARLMWGSDWPVLELAGSYAEWLAQCGAVLGHLSDADQAQIFGGTAARFYGFANE